MDEFEIYSSDSEQIKKLKRQIINLEAQLAIQQHRTETVKGGNLLRTDGEDYYPGEQLDFLLSVLEQIAPRCPENSRARDIVSSILSLNEPVGRGEEIAAEVQKIFKNGLTLSDIDKSRLNSLGFSYTPSRKHPKLRFHDRYMFVIPNSPSDYRESKNALRDIYKCIAVSQKI